MCVDTHIVHDKSSGFSKKFFFLQLSQKKIFILLFSEKKTRQQVLSWNLACFFFRLYGIRICLFHGSTNVIYDVFGLLLGRMARTDSGQMRTVLILEIWNATQYFPVVSVLSILSVSDWFFGHLAPNWSQEIFYLPNQWVKASKSGFQNSHIS